MILVVLIMILVVVVAGVLILVVVVSLENAVLGLVGDCYWNGIGPEWVV